MKKIATFAVCLCLMMSCLSFAGCGGGDGDSGRIDPNEKIDWEKIDWQGENDSTNKIRVVFSTHFKAYYENIIAEFKDAHPEYEVEPIWAPAGDGVLQMQNTLIGAKDSPDLIMGGDVHILSQAGLLLPLNKLAERDDADVDLNDFIEEVLENIYLGEGLYYLPDYFNISLLYYNKKLFDNAALSYPDDTWTFDDFMRAGKALTVREEKNGVYKYTQWGNEFNGTWWSQWMTLVRQMGGDIFNEEGLVCMDTPEAKAAMQRYIDMAGVTQKPETWQNKISPGPSDDDLGKFDGMSTAMCYAGHAGSFEAYNSIALLDWDVELLPIGPSGSRAGGELAVNGYGIFKNSKNKKGSWELLKFMTRKRDLSQLREFSWPAPRKSERDLLLEVAREDRRNPRNVEAVYEAIQYAKTLPRVEYFSDVVQNKVMQYITMILEGKKTVDDALDEMTRVCNDYIRNTYL